MALWFCQRFSNYVQTECLQQASKNVAILKELQKQLDELRLVADKIKEQARNLKVVFRWHDPGLQQQGNDHRGMLLIRNAIDASPKVPPSDTSNGSGPELGMRRSIGSSRHRSHPARANVVGEA